MRTLGQALHITFPPNDTWSRHALAGLGTQVSMDMPVCDVAAGRIWLVSDPADAGSPTLLILTRDRLVFGQTTTGSSGLRWLPLDSVLNLDAIDAPSGFVLHYELALTGGIGLAMQCPDSFVRSLVAVLTSEPLPDIHDPFLSDALGPVENDASALDRLGPPSMTEPHVPDIKIRRTVSNDVVPGESMRSDAESRAVVAPDVAAPDVAAPDVAVAESAAVNEATTFETGFDDFERILAREHAVDSSPVEHAGDSLPSAVDAVHGHLDDSDGDVPHAFDYQSAIGSDGVEVVGHEPAASGPAISDPLAVSEPESSSRFSPGGLPLRTPGAAYSTNPQTAAIQPMVSPSLPTEAAGKPVGGDSDAGTMSATGTNPFRTADLDGPRTQEVPVIEVGHSAWPPSTDVYGVSGEELHAGTEIDFGSTVLEPGTIPGADTGLGSLAEPIHSLSVDSFAESSSQVDASAFDAGSDAAGDLEDDWWTTPSPADDLAWDEVSTTANGSRPDVADGWLGHESRSWEQWPEGAPNVAPPAGFHPNEMNAGVDDFADLAVDLANPGDLAALADEAMPSGGSHNSGLMYAVESNWWSELTAWPEPFRSVTYLGGHPKHPKRRKNVTLHFTKMGLAATTGGLANWALEIPWSRVRSIDIEGSDEIMFRSSLRIDLSSSALVIETDEGTIFFECRLRRPASVRTALAPMTNSMRSR